MKIIFTVFLIFILLFQVVTFGNFQDVEAHRIGEKCVEVNVKAEITKITIQNLNGKDAAKTWFDIGLTGENSGDVEIAYAFWEPDHQKEKDGFASDVIELKKWSLSKHQYIPFTPSTNDKTKAFPLPKHNVYLHKTCWDDVKNLVVNLAVQEVDDGESYKDKWSNSIITKYLASQVTEGTLSSALKISPAGQLLGAVKTLADALVLKGNDIFGADTRIYNIEHQELRKYYTYQFPLSHYDPATKKTNKATAEFRVIILEVPQKQSGLLPYDDTDTQNVSDTIMPEWFKNNALWWKDGLISDQDMINALESLMIQDIISLDKFVKSSSGIEHQAGVSSGGTFEIPSYQKDVFGFWGEGVISDDEIVNSIGHLMSEGIINSQKINEKRTQIISKNNILHQSTIETSPEMIKNLYTFNKLNELTANWLLEIKNTESELFDELSKDTWMKYSDDKNTDLMNRATELDEIQQEATDDANKLVGILHGIGDIEDSLISNAQNMGIVQQDLELSALNILDSFDMVRNLQNIQDVEEAYKQASKAQKQAENKKNQMDSKISNTENKSRNILNIYNQKNVNDAVTSNLEITEKHGRFIGDPCDEKSKKIKLDYKLKKSSGKPIADSILLVVNHSFEGKFIHQHHETNAWGYDDQGVSIGSNVIEFLLYEELPPGLHGFEIKGANLRVLSSFYDYFPSSFIVTEVIVPPCIIKGDSHIVDDLDSAVDDSDEYALINYERKKLQAILEEIIFDSNELNKIIDNGKKTISTLDDSVMDDYLPGLDDDIDEHDPLPGLDYDLTEEEVREIEYEGSSDIELFIISEEIDPNCNGMISIDIGIGNDDLVNQNIGIPIDVTLIETGPRGTLTHIVQTHVGDGQLTINDLPPGTYSFEVKSAILQDNSKIDIFSGNVVYPGGQLNPTTIEDCPDDTSLQDSEESTSSVTSDTQCTEDYFGYGEIKVVNQWASYEADLPYYFFNVGWALQHTNPSYQNNVNSMTVDLDMTGPEGWSPPSKTVRTDGDGNLQIGWSTQNPGTYTFTITNFQNMGSYCGNGDTITLTIP